MPTYAIKQLNIILFNYEEIKRLTADHARSDFRVFSTPRIRHNESRTWEDESFL